MHEYPKYRSHLKTLDVESKTLRFGCLVSDLSIDKFCDKLEAAHSNHILFAIENRELEVIAVGHIALGDVMELAFSMDKQHQGQGFGNLLMKRCIQYCRTHNILKGCMVCLRHNCAIRHLCTKHGIQFQSEHGELVASIELAHAGIDTYISEVSDSNFAMIDYIGKRLPVLWAFNK